MRLRLFVMLGFLISLPGIAKAQAQLVVNVDAATKGNAFEASVIESVKARIQSTTRFVLQENQPAVLEVGIVCSDGNTESGSCAYNVLYYPAKLQGLYVQLGGTGIIGGGVSYVAERVFVHFADYASPNSLQTAYKNLVFDIKRAAANLPAK